MLRASKEMLARTRRRQMEHAQARKASALLRVLVVDDEPDAVHGLTAVLRVSMPDMNGWDLAKEIRQAMGRESPLLVALTGQYTLLGRHAGSGREPRK